MLLQRLRELALPAREALYIDLGDIYFTEHRLLDTVLDFVDRGGKYLFIDEVHRYGLRTWATEIKSIYDTVGQRLRVVFTGSSQTQILLHQADLSRRVIFHRLQGFSYREYLNVTLGVKLPPIEFSDLLRDHQAYLERHGTTFADIHADHFARYLQVGYYPLHLDDVTAYQIQLNTVVQAVLDMDIPYFLGTPQLKKRQLAKLLQAVATSVPFKPNYSKLGERIGLRRQEIETYLLALERACLVRLVPADAQGVAALAKPEKIYLDNPNLLYTLATVAPSIGNVRETFFANQIEGWIRPDALVSPRLAIPKRGDFTIEDNQGRYVFEIGGPNKESKQIGTGERAYTVVDAHRVAGYHRLPLWMFGLLY